MGIPVSLTGNPPLRQYKENNIWVSQVNIRKNLEFQTTFGLLEIAFFQNRTTEIDVNHFLHLVYIFTLMIHFNFLTRLIFFIKQSLFINLYMYVCMQKFYLNQK